MSRVVVSVSIAAGVGIAACAALVLATGIVEAGSILRVPGPLEMTANARNPVPEPATRAATRIPETVSKTDNRLPAAEAKTVKLVPKAARAGKRVPVLVELFTSEGCSSCPAADRVLEQLQAAQPVSNATVVPLSEHVDYWNYIGWTDPFSSSAFSDRQRGYARSLRLDSIYTPQMIVDGRTEFVGSDKPRAEAAIARAAAAAHAHVRLRPLTTGNSVSVQVTVDGIPAVRNGDAVDIVLAVTEDNLRSHVSRGENSGRDLPHVAVVRQLRSVGTATSGKTFTTNAVLPLDSRWKRRDLSVAAFVQERDDRRVLGAALESLDPDRHK